MGLRVYLLDIIKRATDFDKKAGIIQNGELNAYPEIIDRYINNSVTAKQGANMMATYLSGQGFGDEENKIFVKDGLTLLKFTHKLSKSFSKQRGAYVHVNINANFAFDNFDVFPYSHCRKGKKDDNNYNGKIVVYDNWSGENGKVNKDDFQVLDVFNTDKKVIQAQVDKAGGWDKYKGQIWYVNLDDEYDYALSSIDAVARDCDSESQSSIFKNKSLRKGFFGKTLIVTRPLIGEQDSYSTPEDYRVAQSEREDFKQTIDDFIGAENVGGVLHVEMEHDGDTIEDAINVQNIDSNIDDKIFAHTERSIRENIMIAFNNIPSILIQSDNSFFGSSGEAFREAKLFYQDNTKQERDELEQVVQVLMRGFKDPLEVELIPLIDESEQSTEPKKEEE